MTKLTEHGYHYADVRRWPGKAGVDVFDCDVVLVPINIANEHWTAAAVWPQRRVVEYYDSLGDPGAMYTAALVRWAEDEWADKKGAAAGRLPGAPWAVVPPAHVPRQTNGYDCGPFTLAVLDMLAERHPPSLRQGDMATYRRYLALALLKRALPAAAPQPRADAMQRAGACDAYASV